MPVEPPATGWIFADPSTHDARARRGTRGGPDGVEELDDLVAVGADLEPGTLLEAYRHGIFPMPAGEPGDPMYWFSPVRRGVLRPAELRVSRSLRRACRDFEVRVDTAFPAVVEACADPRRPHGWITDEVAEAYLRLHALGWAHSVETWQDGVLVGGLYGLALGGLFAGESMFHRVRDASKVALVALVARLDQADEGDGAERLVDVQWSTPHLASLGVTEIDRADYLAALPGLFATPLPPAFAGRAVR